MYEAHNYTVGSLLCYHSSTVVAASCVGSWKGLFLFIYRLPSPILCPTHSSLLLFLSHYIFWVDPKSNNIKESGHKDKQRPTHQRLLYSNLADTRFYLTYQSKTLNSLLNSKCGTVLATRRLSHDWLWSTIFSYFSFPSEKNILFFSYSLPLSVKNRRKERALSLFISSQRRIAPQNTAGKRKKDPFPKWHNKPSLDHCYVT